MRPVVAVPPAVTRAVGSGDRSGVAMDPDPDRVAARPHGPTPARGRMVRRVRRITFRVLVAALALSAVSSVAAAIVVVPAASGEVIVRLVLVEAVILGGLALVAWWVARRSTRIVESVFGQQDRLMLAVAHELRSPLSRALVATDDGLDGAVDTDEALRDTARHVETTSVLIDDLLEVTRVMSGAAAPPAADVALDEVAASAVRVAVVGEATVELDAQPVVVVGSSRLLRRAVSNLVGNAARHAYHNGPGRIVLRVDGQGVTVLDEGPGVSAARLEDIRYETPLSARREGAGLGLTLCGWVAEMHGGRLDLANRPGGGFSARLVLPTATTGDTRITVTAGGPEGGGESG